MQLEEGWETRTQQKLALAGCLATALALRNSPLTTGSRLRDFAQKLVGYGGASIIFSGVQETCRAARGRHDFLNSALSGAVAGGIVVGHYQGPRYRLLGVVTWGSLCAALHLANAVLQPRVLLEDYLIREGLLSAEVARRREEAALRVGQAAAGRSFEPDVLLESLAIRERELRELNQRLATAQGRGQGQGQAATAGSGRRAAAAAGGTSVAPAHAAGTDTDAGEAEGQEVADDDPGYVAWLRSSGLDAEALLQQQPHAEPAAAQLALRPSQAQAHEGETHEQGRCAAAVGGDQQGQAAPGATPVAERVRRRSWSEWLRAWRFGRRKKVDTPTDGDRVE